jgi:hypothetical protein
VTRVTPVIIAAAAFLLMLDIIGALARQPLGFPYSSLGAVSLLTYFTVGFMGAWRDHFRGGVVAALIVGFLDATLGPLAAWMIGPGPVGQTITEPRIFAYGITVVTLTATGAGLIGAFAGTWLERRRGLRASRVLPH